MLALVNAASSGGVSTARHKSTLIAPAAPGGGRDGFAREGQQALRPGDSRKRWSPRGEAGSGDPMWWFFALSGAL